MYNTSKSSSKRVIKKICGHINDVIFQDMNNLTEFYWETIFKAGSKTF